MGSAGGTRWLAWGGYTAVALGALLAACTATPRVAAPGTGVVQLSVAAAPACAHDHLFVTIDRVRFQADGVDAESIEVALPSPRRVDLAAIAAPAPLATVSLPAGHYDSIQLVLHPNTGNQQLANAVQWRGGALVALKAPQRANVPVDLDVPAGSEVRFTLEPDACNAVQANAQGAPVLRSRILKAEQRVQTAALDPVLP